MYDKENQELDKLKRARMERIIVQATFVVVAIVLVVVLAVKL